MPDTSEKLGLSLPLSSETFTRETYRQNLLQIDEKATAQSQADEPFFLKSAVYNSGLNQIDLIFGKGRTNFNGTMISKTIDSSYNISSPTINTDYYIYLQNDGSYLHNTTGTAVTGAVLIWKVQTGTTTGQLSATDLRDQLPGSTAKAVYDSLQQEVSDLAGTGRTTETVKGNANALSAHLAETSPHSATSAATANKLIVRDASGRAKVAAPSATDDIARKDTVDAVQTNLNTHLAETMPHKFVDGATTYRWGLSVVGGVVMFNYEEVI